MKVYKITRKIWRYKIAFVRMHKKKCKICASLCTLKGEVLLYFHCNPPIHFIVFLLYPIRNEIPSPKRTAYDSGPFYFTSYIRDKKTLKHLAIRGKIKDS